MLKWLMPVTDVLSGAGAFYKVIAYNRMGLAPQKGQDMTGSISFYRILRAAQHEEFCDVGHYYCPRLAGGRLIFPAGVVRDDDTFSGAGRLFDLLKEVEEMEERMEETGSHESRRLNLFADGEEMGGLHHYPSGTECPISLLPRRVAHAAQKGCG